jgi:hypothetical protein
MGGESLVGQKLEIPKGQKCPVFNLYPQWAFPAICILSIILDFNGTNGGALDITRDGLENSIVRLPAEQIAEGPDQRRRRIAQFGERCTGCQLHDPLVNAYSNRT